MFLSRDIVLRSIRFSDTGSMELGLLTESDITTLPEKLLVTISHLGYVLIGQLKVT